MRVLGADTKEWTNKIKCQTGNLPFSSQDVQPDHDKIRAVLEMPRPTSRCHNGRGALRWLNDSQALVAEKAQKDTYRSNYTDILQGNKERQSVD